MFLIIVVISCDDIVVFVMLMVCEIVFKVKIVVFIWEVEN